MKPWGTGVYTHPLPPPGFSSPLQNLTISCFHLVLGATSAELWEPPASSPTFPGLRVFSSPPQETPHGHILSFLEFPVDCQNEPSLGGGQNDLAGSIS